MSKNRLRFYVSFRQHGGFGYSVLELDTPRTMEDIQKLHKKLKKAGASNPVIMFYEALDMEISSPGTLYEYFFSFDDMGGSSYTTLLLNNHPTTEADFIEIHDLLKKHGHNQPIIMFFKYLGEVAA